jgi:hypothetical protein
MSVAVTATKAAVTSNPAAGSTTRIFVKATTQMTATASATAKSTYRAMTSCATVATAMTITTTIK